MTIAVEFLRIKVTVSLKIIFNEHKRENELRVQNNIETSLGFHTVCPGVLFKTYTF